MLNSNELEADLNQSAGVMDNFNQAQGREHGLYLFFRVTEGILGRCSVYWTKAIILKFLRVLFPTATLIYVDSDAVIFLPVLFQYLWAFSHLEEDMLLAATDVNSPLNAGWFCVLSSSAHFSRGDFDPSTWTDELRNYGRHLERLLKQRAEELVCSLPESSSVSSSRKMSAAVMSAIWKASGLHLLRPSCVDEAIEAWLLFGRFGAIHWTTGRGDVHARAAVPGSHISEMVAGWARSAYEQLCLAWVFRLVEAAGCNVFRIFSCLLYTSDAADE